MIGDLKPYPAMKDSGVPWLGRVPAHWETERAKWLFRKMNRPVRDSDEVVTCFRDGTVTLRKNRRVRGFTESLKEIGYQGIRRGDLVIHAMDAFAGAIGVADADGKGTPVYSVCEPGPTADSHYYAYAVREMARSQWIQSLAKGIRERSTDFRFEGFGSQPVPLPPLPEQAAIVRFLDHADRRIRRYIRAKQKLIKLLEEQKAAIIHRAVTRGLDPNVRLKPSGVEWLGDVPEHWEVSRVKNEFLCLNRRRVPLSATERGAMTLRRYDYYGASGIIDKVDEYLFDDDLLLVAEDGANLVLRNLPLAIVARGQFWVNNHAHILKPRRGRLEYLAAVMERINYQPWISGAAQPKLTQDRLMGIAIAVAPPEEQDGIVRAISEETAPLRTTIERARREIDLLREYRTRLIADVVTGKLDVREAAARLPQEAEELEPLEETEALGEMEGEAAADDLEPESQEADA
jgi:type I restriction enzyme S subunit